MKEQFFSEFLGSQSIVLRAIPNATQTEVIEKMEDGVWKLRVAAPSHKGKANTELLKFIRQTGKISAKIIQGEKTRLKTLQIL